MISRRDQILNTAAELFAKHGFHGVSIADLGASAGISGPGIYKHFRSKQSILAVMLVSISEELLAEGRRRIDAAPDKSAALDALIDWHVGFALTQPSLIVVQDRDWAALPFEAREKVRDLQRAYVDAWVNTLRAVRPDHDLDTARAVVHAAFGLINSTPHSAVAPSDQMHAILCAMARGALTAP